jgi:hypothetical protein
MDQRLSDTKAFDEEEYQGADADTEAKAPESQRTKNSISSNISKSRSETIDSEMTLWVGTGGVTGPI